MLSLQIIKDKTNKEETTKFTDLTNYERKI
jgi:hypothetical protein